jgi:hypothetical protein
MRLTIPAAGLWPKPLFFAALALFSTLCLSGTVVSAEQSCLDGTGSAAIISNDVPSAKLEASARARWAVIERAVGVEIHSQTLVENSALLDDLISMTAKGTITSSKVIEEKREADVYNVTLNACIEPAKAADAVASLALNNSVAVFIPARKPRVLQDQAPARGAQGVEKLTVSDEQDETNIFSETLIGKLVEQGYTVTDIAPSRAVDADAVEKAIKSGNFVTMRSLIGKFLSNVLLIGKIDYTISQRKGEDIGYDVEMPYNRVTVRLSYRLLTRDADSGKLVILAAGTADAKGSAGNLEDAAANGMHSLSNKVIPGLLEKFAKHIKGVSRKVTVKVDGLDGVEGTLDAKRVLSGITWVSDVQSVGLNEYLLSYPENSIYLANSLSRHPRLKVIDYSAYLIHLGYRK